MVAPASVLLAVTAVAALQLVAGLDESDCAALQDSILLDDQCVCPDYFFANDDYTRCLPPALEGGSVCEAATQCSTRLGLGVHCVDGVCICGDGYHYIHGICRKSVGLGEACAESDDCFDNHATHTLTCSDENVCACAESAYLRNGVCRLKALGAGDSCDFDEDCKKSDESLGCYEHVCSDGEGSQPDAGAPALNEEVDVDSYKLRTALRPTAANITCIDSSECEATEECSVLETCICQKGSFRDSDGVCKLELGEKCDDNSDCEHIWDARCGETDSKRGKTCHCGPRWVPGTANDFCRIARKMDYSCAVDANCFNFGEGGVCSDYKCNCASDFRYIEDRSFCWPNKALDEECTNQLDCYLDGAICKGGVCACDSGYHQTASEICLKDITALGDSCETDAECSAVADNSVCTSGRCSCSPGYVQTGSTSCDVGVEGDCSADIDCASVLGAFCDNVTDTCSCQDGYTVSTAGVDCLRVATEEGANCSDSVQCEAQLGANSTCDAELAACLCRNGTHFADGACWTTLVVGAECSRTSECFAPSSRDGLKCLNGVCRCDLDLKLADDGSACISGAASWLLLPSSTAALLVLTMLSVSL